RDHRSGSDRPRAVGDRGGAEPRPRRDQPRRRGPRTQSAGTLPTHGPSRHLRGAPDPGAPVTSASRKAKGEPSQRPESPASGPVSQPPGAGPLPPPVRRTRWLIGSFLGLSMVGVVIFAYLRIEREL